MERKHGLHNWFILPVIIYIIIYALYSASFLTRFPFVHSDEAWLAGLSRDMQAVGSFGATEQFFDLKPRVPHALKLLFHALQMGYVHVFGYNILSVRLLSLTSGLICLILLYYIGKELGGRWMGFGLMVLVSLDVPFIYASHFGRQEIILCISLLSCILILIRCQGCPSTRQALYLASITGLSVGIHPNSFLCASICGSVMAACGFNMTARHWHKQILSLAIYTAVTGALASIFVGISFLFDAAFIPDYFRYGEQEFELGQTASSRLIQFLYYFKSIYAQESGTYYIPDQRLELILIPVLMVLLLLIWLFLKNVREDQVSVWRSHTLVLLSSMTGLSLGMVIVGRYNQTSVIFFLLLGWISMFQLMLLAGQAGRSLTIGLTFILLVLNSRVQITPFLHSPSYTHYLEQLGQLVPKDSKVLANLNTGFYFDQGMLLDYRNLPYLEQGYSLDDYIRNNKIQYILMTDELDYIYENRPYYNVIYGNSSFIQDLGAYCASDCILAGTFENPLYGPRIISLIGNPQYGTVSVYKVMQDNLPSVP